MGDQKAGGLCLPISVRLRERNLLEPPADSQHEENDENQSERAARRVAPAPAVRPRGNRSNEHQKKNDDQNSDHLVLLRATGGTLPSARSYRRNSKAHATGKRLKGRASTAVYWAKRLD